MNEQCQSAPEVLGRHAPTLPRVGQLPPNVVPTSHKVHRKAAGVGLRALAPGVTGSAVLRLAIMLAPLGSDYLPGDLVFVSPGEDAEAAVRVHHVLAAREATAGAWAPPGEVMYAPAGTRKDDLRLALACHRIARNFGCVLDERAAAEAAFIEAFGAQHGRT